MPEMTQDDLSKMIDFTAHRCFLGDRARETKHGGNQLPGEVVEVSGDYVGGEQDVLRIHVKTSDGRTAFAPVNGQLVPRGIGRELRPADLHDAAHEAMVRAGQCLPGLEAAETP